MNGRLVVRVDAGEAPVVVLEGDLDLTSAPDLDALLTTLAGAHRHITVDCRALRFIDAAGIRTLARSHARLARCGGDLTVRELPALARRLVHIVGLDDLLGADTPGPRLGLTSVDGVATDREDGHVVDRAEA